MPSEKILEEKKKIVEEMTERLKSQAGVFVDYKGITVNEDTELRVKMRDANVNYSVIRNRLMKLAIKNVGFDDLESILVGTTSLAICDEDPVAPARIVKEYADKLKDYLKLKPVLWMVRFYRLTRSMLLRAFRRCLFFRRNFSEHCLLRLQALLLYLKRQQRRTAFRQMSRKIRRKKLMLRQMPLKAQRRRANRQKKKPLRSNGES